MVVNHPGIRVLHKCEISPDPEPGGLPICQESPRGLLPRLIELNRSLGLPAAQLGLGPEASSGAVEPGGTSSIFAFSSSISITFSFMI